MLLSNTIPSDTTFGIAPIDVSLLTPQYTHPLPVRENGAELVVFITGLSIKTQRSITHQLMHLLMVASHRY